MKFRKMKDAQVKDFFKCNDCNESLDDFTLFDGKNIIECKNCGYKNKIVMKETIPQFPIPISVNYWKEISIN